MGPDPDIPVLFGQAIGEGRMVGMMRHPRIVGLSQIIYLGAFKKSVEMFG
jgi:hypothetical protein